MIINYNRYSTMKNIKILKEAFMKMIQTLQKDTINFVMVLSMNHLHVKMRLIQLLYTLLSQNGFQN